MTSKRLLHSLSDLFNISLATSLRRLPALEAPLTGCSKLLYGANSVSFVEIVRERLRRAVSRRAQERADVYRVVKLATGAQMVVDITGLMGDLYFNGAASYEPQTTQFITARLSRGETFVDVGANVGYFSILAASRVGSEGKVYAFEPNPNLHGDFKRSVQINGFENLIRLTEVAISSADSDEVDFFISLAEANTGLSTLTPAKGHLETGSLSLGHKITVPARTLDSWMKETGLSHIDMLKIDVEGAEEIVLDGMQETLADARPSYIICETYLEGAVSERLRRRGYSASGLDTSPEGWGNILYSLDR
ncbi:MAG TPA: FkbM family methyltransferase [Pyrinomonadaceae bacterium]|jgi:FkbM family methyltransferase